MRDAGVVREQRALVVLDRLTKVYREGDSEHVVLAGASARVAEGEFVALLGPSGSGKSTLLHLIGGLDSPTSGEVTIGGVTLTSLDERARTLFRRHHIGFVFQFLNLIPTLTVEENVLFPLELSHGRASPARARSLLERVELAHRADSFPDRLSGGEQQRIALARALVHEPMLVLADEPTGNLDAATGERVLALMESLTRESGRTLIVVTHSERIVERADRVLELRDGVLVRRGGQGERGTTALGAG
ncbi:MAG: ABC transporter ATP-binding protein [Longimicrobiales bacterium]